jgi:glyoxylase-like metal-dependent hydrolase (beta-lactamase superfamily II)
MSIQRPLWTEHEGGIVQIRVPLPFPLRWVNAYLLKDEEGWTAIDPGLGDGASREAWLAAMRAIGIGLRDIRQIVLTHHHPDHLGLAGRFQEASGAPVFLSPEGAVQMRELWGDGQPMTERLLHLFAVHGMDDAMLANMREHLESFVPLVSPLPDVTPLRPGVTFAMGGRGWHVLEAHGHARGQLMFFDRESGDLICGDQVLPAITPNVSVLPGHGDDPLGEFLDSLKRLAGLPAGRTYPGHREPFGRFSERCQDIIRHHRERLERLAALADEPATAWDVCIRFFGRDLSVHQLRFAMGETLAHLAFLEKKGELVRLEETGRVRWVRRKA